LKPFHCQYLQGSVAMHLRCGVILNNRCIEKVLLSVPLCQWKNFGKSVNHW